MIIIRLIVFNDSYVGGPLLSMQQKQHTEERYSHLGLVVDLGSMRYLEFQIFHS